MKIRILGIMILIMNSTILFSQETEQSVESYLSRYQYQQAIDYLEQKNDTSKEASMQKVLCYNYLHNYPKGIEILLSLQEKYPYDMQVKLQLASFYNKMSMLSESLNCFDELIKMDSDNIYFRIQKADLLYQSSKYDQALEEYKYAANAYNSSYLLKQIAFCFKNDQQRDSAKIYFEQALRIDSLDKETQVELIKIEISNKDYESGLALSERFISKDTNNIQINILKLKSLCYYELKDYKTAAENFERCHSLGDTSLFVNKYLGFSYYFDDENDKACPYLIQAYKQDTTNNNVLYALAVVNQQLENYPEAIRLYEALIQRVVLPNYILYTYYKKLADSYAKNKDYLFAIENYKKALLYFSENQDMELLFNLADIYDIQLHNYEMALNYYKQYRESLIKYLQLLTAKDNINENKDEVEGVSRRIENLDEQIIYIEGKIKK